MKALRQISALLVVGASIWFLWPPSPQLSASQVKAGSKGDRKYVLHVSPGLYMPGRRLNPGDPPLKQLQLVADEFEKLNPDTRIEFEDPPTGEREWLVIQLASGTAPDIVNVNVGDVWQDVQKGWYVPLDKWLERPNPYVKPGEPGSKQWWDIFKYQAITRGKAAPDGNSYCVTLDMIETGIFYNKTLFRKLGIAPPKDWADFERIETIIKKAGIVPMLASVDSLADWGLDLTFDQLYRDIRPTLALRMDPRRAKYLKAYLDWDELCFLHKKGFFTKDDPRWREIFRLLKKWRPFLPKDLGSTDNIREFVVGDGAMLWMHSELVDRLVRDPNLNFDWGVFYLPPITSVTSRFGIGAPECVIGGAATQFEVTNSAFGDTKDPETSERLKRCMSFLQFVTLPRNCQRITNETSALLPNAVGTEPRPEMKVFDTILKRDFATTKWEYTFDLRFTEVLNRMLLLYMEDGISLDGFMDWIDSNVDLATANIERRKNLDLSPFEPLWKRAAPLRAHMKELPVEAR